MKEKIGTLIILFILIHAVVAAQNAGPETFVPLIDGQAPQTVEELWKDIDPRKEPLDVEVLHEWEEDGVIMKVLRYRIGIFKGQKAMMAAIYGYPIGGSDLPGLVQAHGGGQYADYRAVLSNGKRGYATISISWAGRINAPDYKVNRDIVKLFWDNKTDDPEYKVTTDWGALDAYHAPSINPGNESQKVEPAHWTYDSIESPRNCCYFLWTLGARRALTFLERQPEVDPERLGIYGHSMGAKITILTAGIDPRVKAAAPSCGGISNSTSNQLYQSTLADAVYLEQLSCPVIFLNPTNDFHGRIEDIPKAVNMIKTKEWRVVSAPHHKHQDLGESEVTGMLWFDQHLKENFSYPETPGYSMELNTSSGTPAFSVIPDPSMPILEVDVFYTQQGENNGPFSDRDHRKARFWHYARCKKQGDQWKADLPLYSTNKSVWAFAKLRYGLADSVSGAGYYYRIYKVNSFNLSTPIQIVSSEQVEASGAEARLKPDLLIESFDDDWEKEWFTYRSEFWDRKTNKLYNELWRAPEKAGLRFEVQTAEANKLLVGIDNYVAEISLKGGKDWQKIVLIPEDFTNPDGKKLTDFLGIKEFRLGSRDIVSGRNGRQHIGGDWVGEDPVFRELKWITEQE